MGRRWESTMSLPPQPHWTRGCALVSVRPISGSHLGLVSSFPVGSGAWGPRTHFTYRRRPSRPGHHGAARSFPVHLLTSPLALLFPIPSPLLFCFVLFLLSGGGGGGGGEGGEVAVVAVVGVAGVVSPVSCLLVLLSLSVRLWR